MAKIQWTEDMSVGVASIDTDHRILLSLVTHLGDAIDRGQGQTAIGRVLDALLDYTAYHFGREEALMQACGYPDAEAHAQTHQILRIHVAHIRDRYNANPDTIHPLEVQAFLNNWLTAHIMGRDKLYAPFLVSKPKQMEEAERRYAEEHPNVPRVPLAPAASRTFGGGSGGGSGPAQSTTVGGIE